MISTDRLRRVAFDLNNMGENAFLELYDVKPETLKRYEHLIKSAGITLPILTPKLRVLVLDIETSLIKASVFGVWKTNIQYTNIIKDWSMLSWSAKWLNEPDVYGERVTSTEAIKGTDYSIMHSLWMMLNEADVVIAHNGQKFDIPRINTRFVMNGLTKPSPFRQIDTLLVVRKQFGFTHNKLDALLGAFNIKGKTETNMQLWIDCGDGNEEAIDKMLAYNKNDVVILEDLYHRIKGWIPSHPRMYSTTDGSVCEVCGSDKINSNGEYSTNVNNYESFTCEDCGAILRKRNINSNELIVAAR